MNNRLISLLGSVVLTVNATAAIARDTHVGVEVDGENVEVQVIVNEKIEAGSAKPKGYARDANMGCLYQLFGKALSDEYAHWNGDCDARGYITGYGRLKYVYPSGAPGEATDYREGVFRDGRLHGRGTSTLLNGYAYHGTFQNGRPHGSGEVHLVDGSVYRGEIRMGKATGAGRLDYANGDRYTGSFVNGDRSGQGELVKANGARYKGAFRFNRPSGQGLFIKADGTCFEGTFINGRAHPQNVRKMQCLHLKDGGIVRY